jgi:hypothetical protein
MTSLQDSYLVSVIVAGVKRAAMTTTPECVPAR